MCVCVCVCICVCVCVRVFVYSNIYIRNIKCIYLHVVSVLCHRRIGISCSFI